MVKTVGIKKTFGKSNAAVHALRGVDFTVDKGEMVAIMGKSGSGKSTLLNILGALMTFDEGTYEFNGKRMDLKRQSDLTVFRRDKVGFIVQYFALIDDMTVFENVALSLRYQKRGRKEIKTRVNEALALLEMEDKIKAYPDELSGGQQQRVSIARAIVRDPEMILADEPTGALDEATEEGVLNVFDELHKVGKTIILVTHDEKVAKRCGRVVYLKDGKVERKE